jgi:hypothetical protein
MHLTNISWVQNSTLGHAMELKFNTYMIYPKSRVNVDGITVDESITSTFLLDE